MELLSTFSALSETGDAGKDKGDLDYEIRNRYMNSYFMYLHKES